MTAVPNRPGAPSGDAERFDTDTQLIDAAAVADSADEDDAYPAALNSDGCQLVAHNADTKRSAAVNDEDPTVPIVLQGLKNRSVVFKSLDRRARTAKRFNSTERAKLQFAGL